MNRTRRFRDRPLRSYRDATDFLESLVRPTPRTRRERERLGLTPIESLLNRLGNPHRAVAAIHITGSKGKGSTALHTEALLTAAGVRSGTFTSPHLEDWTERIRVDGATIDRARFVTALERVRPAVAEMQDADPYGAPAFFDALVAAAFSVFADASVEIAVIEAGIGARLDPTRICHAIATCVTGVELEHTDRLGPGLFDIAREKAAIARPGVPLVIGTMPDAARGVLEREASRTGAPLRCLDNDVGIGRAIASPPPGCNSGEQGRSAESGTGAALHCVLADVAPAEVRLAGRTIPVSLRQPGRHMLENAALALVLANEVGALSRLDDAAAGAALEATALPGRLEVLRVAPLVIADGAHTRASVEALVGTVDARHPARIVAVVSATRGKDAAHVLEPLVRRADAVVATSAEPSRSLPAAELARSLERRVPRTTTTCFDFPSDAIRAAMGSAGRDGIVCVTGSMYMAGAARRILPPA